MDSFDAAILNRAKELGLNRHFEFDAFNIKDMIHNGVFCATCNKGKYCTRHKLKKFDHQEYDFKNKIRGKVHRGPTSRL